MDGADGADSADPGRRERVQRTDAGGGSLGYDSGGSSGSGNHSVPGVGSSVGSPSTSIPPAFSDGDDGYAGYSGIAGMLPSRASPTFAGSTSNEK